MEPGSSSHLNTPDVPVESVPYVESDEFAEQVQGTIECTSDEDIPTLRWKADELITRLEGDPYDNYVVSDFSVKLSRILRAMVEHAESCSGKPAIIYTCATVVACSRKNGEVDRTIESLLQLAKAWLTHFLFVVRGSLPHPLSTQTPSLGLISAFEMIAATPGVDGGAESCDHTLQLAEKIMRRDGFQCVVNGKRDPRHPDVLADPDNADFVSGNLEAVHILRQVFGEVTKNPHSPPHKSIVSTVKILQNYCGLSNITAENQSLEIDALNNGFILENNAHKAFSAFYWTLVPYEGKNKYKIEVLNRRRAHGLNLPGADIKSRIVEFKDYSGEGLEIPHPRYFRTHAAIASILHASGAGIFLDGLLEKYGYDEDSYSVPSFENLLRRIEIHKLREQLKALR
ncbi:hypothetical protein BDN72DRAFT_881228 [Pluteus cervinus]|uniref:Uncharacterized protein n=1 Tax=Pluteus cervinus TaxID=181527 RepID=A0ACD3AJ99_9AGAR|nr:hypothetical protein BDN72DRAFT_881228 [Pluteus cervinus]